MISYLRDCCDYVVRSSAHDAVIGVILAGGFLLAPYNQTLCAADSAYWSLLEAHSAGVDSYEAQIQFQHFGGSGREKLAEAKQQLADALRAEGSADLADAYAVQAETLRKTYPVEPALTVRYYADASGRMRLEWLDEQANPATVEVFDGEVWKVYRADNGADDSPSMAIVGDSDGQWLDVARGASLPKTSVMGVSKLGLELTTRARATYQVAWSELLALLDPETVVEDHSPLPGGDRMFPSLTATSASLEKYGQGAFRMRVWFDPDAGYSLVAAECASLYPNNQGSGAHSHLPERYMEWQDFTQIGEHYVPKKCTLKRFRAYLVPTEGLPTDRWPNESAEVRRTDFVISKLRVGQPHSDSLFDVVPALGTNVIDEARGYRYIVGNAGEELRKTALSQSPISGEPDQVQQGRGLRIVLIAVNLVLLIGFVLIFLLRQRRAR